MENNRFDTRKTDIRKIGENNHVDISTAALTLATREGWTDYEKELDAFEAYVAELQRKTTKDNNLVASYFAD